MARSFTAASSMYLTKGSAIVTGIPMTMACWFNPNDVTGTHSLISVADTGSGNAYYLLVARGGDAGDPVTAQQGDAGSSYLASTSTSFVANTWQHAAAVFSTTNVRVAYLNGGGRVENNGAASTNDTLLDTTAIGVLQRSTLAAHCDGLIAEAGLWNVALTNEEIALLAAGYAPICVRPAALMAYWPLLGRTSPEIDLKGRFELTLVNAPAVAAHVGIRYRPRLQQWRHSAGATIIEADGASAGIGAATGIGALTFVSIGAAAGVGTAASLSGATKGAAAAAAGTGTAAGIGSLIVASVGASSGSAVATGVSGATAGSVATSAGVGTATGLGQATAHADGTSVGTSTVLGVGQAIVAAEGVAAGVSVATADAQVTIAGVAFSEGLGTAFADGTDAAAVGGDGSSDGLGIALGVGQALATAQAEADGTSTVLGESQALTAASAVSAGNSTADAISGATVSAVGSSAGTGAALGEGVDIGTVIPPAVTPAPSPFVDGGGGFGRGWSQWSHIGDATKVRGERRKARRLRIEDEEIMRVIKVFLEKVS